MVGKETDGEQRYERSKEQKIGYLELQPQIQGVGSRRRENSTRYRQAQRNYL